MSQKLIAHPLAEIFPLPTADEQLKLNESIAKLGQHEEIVLLDGQILDGRSRYQSCLNLGREVLSRDFDPKHDGDSPTDYVVMKNLDRRHLTAQQKAQIGLTLMPFYEAEAAERKKGTQFGSPTRDATVSTKKSSPEGEPKKESVKAATKAARAAGVSTSTMEKAIAEKKKQEGKPAEQGTPPDHDPDEELKSLRVEHKTTLTERHGTDFWKAVRDGCLLKTEHEINAFMDLTEKEQKDILELVKEHWPVTKAKKFIYRLVEAKDSIADLFRRTISSGKKVHTFFVEGWRIRVDRERTEE